MDTQNETTTTKNWFVRNHVRILYTVTAAAIITVVLMRSGIKAHDEFLKRHGLYEEYYNYHELNG